MLLAILTAALFQGAPLPAPAELDTLPYDSPATGVLVERVIRAGSTIPPELRDYRADSRSAVYLSVATDSAQGGETPVTVDEFAGELRWERAGALRQQIRAHRLRTLTPTAYTVGTLLENPWIVPHLYGHTIEVFQLSPARPTSGRRVSRAVHPFSPRGPDLYRYEAGDTLRVGTQEGVVTLVEVRVRPRELPEGGRQVVAGSFYVDVDRAAVARARFGFTDPGGGGLLRLSRAGVFFEMENGLVQGRYWLPYRQRQEVQITSPLFGGAAAIRVVSLLSGYDLNTGWAPPGGERLALVREEDGAFRGWRAPIGEGFGEVDIADFEDLRRATLGVAAEEDRIRVGFVPERSSHLFRYNRVEGPFLGAAAEVEIPVADDARWEVYGTAGWAFAESTARGELLARHVRDLPSAPGEARRWTVEGGAYRRLREAQAFRPTARWELGYTLAAALGGYDILDYYDATGVEALTAYRSGPWTLRGGGALGGARLRFPQHGALPLRRRGELPPRLPRRSGDARRAGGGAPLRARRGGVHHREQPDRRAPRRGGLR